MEITTQPKPTKLLSSDLKKNKQPDKQQIQPCKATLSNKIFQNTQLLQVVPFQLGQGHFQQHLHAKDIKQTSQHGFHSGQMSYPQPDSASDFHQVFWSSNLISLSLHCTPCKMRIPATWQIHIKICTPLCTFYYIFFMAFYRQSLPGMKYPCKLRLQTQKATSVRARAALEQPLTRNPDQKSLHNVSTSVY